MNDTGRQFGSAELGRRMDAFFKELLGLVSDTTDEAVHETRIESRRMRAALEAFRDIFPRRPFDSVYREVRQITRILGVPRESAVSMALIRDLTENRPADPSCLEYLHKRFASRLKKQEKQLRKKLGRIDPHRLRSRVEFLISKIDANEKRAASSSQPALFQMSESALEQGARVLEGLTSSIREFPAIRRFEQASDEELHTLRIAAKKARYVMEIYSSVWPGGLSDQIDKARKFQQAAGKYNDWSVLCRHFVDEVGRLNSPDSIGLAFEIGKLSSYVEMLKKDLKVRMRGALIEFQKNLSCLSYAHKSPCKLKINDLSRVTRKTRQKKSSPSKIAGQDVA
jgi:CHAD domain-containing protein